MDSVGARYLAWVSMIVTLRFSIKISNGVQENKTRIIVSDNCYKVFIYYKLGVRCVLGVVLSLPYGLKYTSTLDRCSTPGMRTPISLSCNLTQVPEVTL